MMEVRSATDPIWCMEAKVMGTCDNKVAIPRPIWEAVKMAITR